jgi:hypothetical protein
MQRMASANLERAKEFGVETLARLRMQFYEHVAQCTNARQSAVRLHQPK